MITDPVTRASLLEGLSTLPDAELARLAELVQALPADAQDVILTATRCRRTCRITLNMKRGVIASSDETVHRDHRKRPR